MPGKLDCGAGGAVCSVFASHQAKAWDAGWRYRYSGSAAAVPITDNPYDQNVLPVEYAAWNNGWNEAAANSGGAQRGPATTGAPPA